MKLRPERIATVCLLAFVAASCSTVPLTGRQQLTLVPEGQLRKMSLAEYRKTISQATLSSDAEKTAMVRRVAESIPQTEELARMRGVTLDSETLAEAWRRAGEAG